MLESYDATRTAILLLDRYYDFLSEGGKFHAPAKNVVDAVGTVRNMRAIVDAARAAGIRKFYVPHHRSRPADFKE